ncbi:MAG: hypothetical protein ACM3YN_01495 [Parcubacteria group bacterium]
MKIQDELQGDVCPISITDFLYQYTNTSSIAHMEYAAVAAWRERAQRSMLEAWVFNCGHAARIISDCCLCGLFRLAHAAAFVDGDVRSVINLATEFDEEIFPSLAEYQQGCR